MTNPTHPTWMELDADALRFNLAEIRRRSAPGVKIIASVKANAYGHGIVPVGRILADAGVEILATGSFVEAKAMRDAGITTPILMLAGALPDGMADLLANELIPTVYDMQAARAVAAAADGPTSVYLKVDCGLGRLGVQLDQATALVSEINSLNNVRVDGIYTHVSFKDAGGMAYTNERLDLFRSVVSELKDQGHEIAFSQALASSALMLGWTDDCTAVCPGHVLFGLSPVSAKLADISPFKPALRALKSRIIHVADHSTGPAIGSGGYHASRKHRRTAVMPCGLNDGYRPAVNGQTASVLFGARRLDVIGVSLEHLTIDIPDDVEISIGDEVTIVGGDAARISIEQLADWLDVSPLQAMLTLSGRMPVEVVG